MKRRLIKVLLLGTISILLASSLAQNKGPVIVGSKLDSEGKLLGQMIYLVLEQAGFKVIDRTATGPTNTVRAALLQKQIDIYPEYTGTAINNFFKDQKISASAPKNAKLSYESVKALDKKLNNIEWLERAPASNSFAIAVRQDMHDGQLKTLSDLAEYIVGGGDFKIAGSQEFFERNDAMKSFEETYKFFLSNEQKIIMPNATTAQTEAAAVQGKGGANAAMAYGTDGPIAALGLVVLADPKGAQPVYQPAPTVRGKLFQQYPEMAKILNPVFRSLSTEVLQNLNSQIDLEGRTPSEVARMYLRDKGFLK